MRLLRLKFPAIKKRRLRTRTRTWVSLGILLVLLPIIIVSLYRPNTPDAAWADEDYAFRKRITFTHNEALTDRRVTVTVDTATLISQGKMQSDCDDTRFTDINGLTLSYQLTGTCDNAATTYDILYPTIHNGQNASFMYYGNASVVSQSIDISGYTSASPSGGAPALQSEEKGTAPSAWWKMDDGSGTVARDSAPGSKNASLGGTISSGITQTPTSSLRQEINIIDTIATASGDHPALVSLDTSKYSGTVSYYFEVVATVASSSLTVALERAGTSTQDATVTVTETSFTRKRSTAFTPPAGATEYNINLSGGTTPQVKAARIIIMQEEAGITASESQFEIGNHETGKNNTTAAALSNPKYWTYTAANWDPTPTFYAEANYKKASDTGYSPPTYEAKGAFASGRGNLSVGVPSGYQDGDVFLLFVESANQTISTPSGWTQVTNSPQYTGTAATAGGVRLGVFYKVVSGSQSAVTVTDTGNHTTAIIANFRGVDNTTPIHITAGGVDSSATNSLSWPSVTTSIANTLIVNVAGLDKDGADSDTLTGTWTNANLSSLTERHDQTYQGGVGGGVGFATGVKATAGAVGNTTVTADSSTTHAYLTIALTPSIIDTSPSVTIKLQEDDGSFGNWADKATIVSSGTASASDLVRSSAFTPVDGRNYRIVASISNSASTYDIYNAKIVAVQATGGDGETLDSYSESNADSYLPIYFGIGNPPSTAQSFQTGPAATILSTASFYIKRVGDPVGYVTAKLYAHGGTYGTSSVPTGSALAISDSIDISTISTSPSLVGFTFSGANQYNLQPGTEYVIAIDFYNGGASDYLDVARDGSSPSHSGNSSTVNITWSATASYDLIFYVTGALPSSITKTESQYLLANTGSFGGSTGLKDFDTYFDPDEWVEVTNTYYHEGNGASSGTGDIKLQSDPNGTPADITNSAITDTVEVERSSALTMPGTASTIDVNVTGTGTLNASKIIAAVDINTSGSGGGATVSAPAWKNKDLCISNSCLYFAGSDTGAIVANSDTVDFDSGFAAGFTWSGWIKANTDGEGDSGQIFNKGTNSFLRVGGQSGNTMNLVASLDLETSAATVTATGAINANKWHHVALSYTDDADDEITIWVDGKAVATSSNGSGSPTAGDSFDFTIGHGLTAEAFHGFIDDVRIYNYERSGAEMKNVALGGFTNGDSSSIFGSRIENYLSDGLVGYWNMDEASWNGTSGEVKDKSENGNNGTSAGDAAIVNGKYGNAGTFDGTGDRIAVTNSTSLMPSSAVSVAAWINPAALGDWYRIAAKMGAGEALGYMLDLTNTNNARFRIDSTSCTTTTTLPATSAWYHIVGTYDGSAIKVYINGQLEQSCAYTTAISSNTEDFVIADRSDVNTPFNGKIDEVRLYNRGLSVSEVKALYQWSPQPIGYWELNEASGTTAYDSSGNGLTGTLAGTMTDSDWVAAKYGNGLDFDGSDDQINTADISSILNLKSTAPPSFTVEGWFYKTDTSGGDLGGVMLTTLTDGGYGRLMYRASNSTIYFQLVPGSTSVSYAAAVNSWYHAAGVYDKDSNTMKLYVNGVLQGTATPASVNLSSITTTSVTIGNAQHNYKGVIDDVKVYNYARTGAQIVQDMNAGHPLGGSPIASQVAYLKFDEMTGTTINNSGLSALSSSSSGATWKTESDCKINGCLDFDGTDDVVTVTNATAIDLNDNLSSGVTFSAWIYPDTVGEGSAGEIFVKSATTYCRLGGTAPFNLSCSLDLGTDATVTVNSVIPASTWTHVAMSWTDDSDDEITVWVNGLPRGASTNGVGPTSAESSNLLVGGGTSNNFDGKIDDFKVYSSELTADELKIDMNANSTISFGTGGPTEASQNLGAGVGNPPFAYWQMDENTGTALKDTSGNGNNGTITNPVWGPGKIGAGLQFNDTARYALIPNPSLSTGDFTYSGWINPITTTDEYIFMRSDGTGNNVLNIFLGTGKLVIRINQVDRITSATTIPTNTWTHFSITRTGSAMTMYLNGKVDGTATFGDTIAWLSGNCALVIGADVDSFCTSSLGNYFNGTLDDLKIYNYGRTATQVAYDYNRGAPVGHWKMDECSGSTAYDSSGNGKNGTINPGDTSGSNDSVGTCTGSTGEMWADGATGKLNSSLEFDGTNDYVDIGDTTRTDIMAVSFWVKPADTTEDILQLSATDSVEVSSGTVTVNGFGTETIYVDGKDSSTIPDTNWHHITVVSSSAITANDMDIGRISTTYFTGQIDDVRIYNYALSQDHIRKIAIDNSGARFGPAEGQPE